MIVHPLLSIQSLQSCTFPRFLTWCLRIKHQHSPLFPNWNQSQTNFFLHFGVWRREDGNPQHDDGLLCPAEQNQQTRKKKNGGKVRCGKFKNRFVPVNFPQSFGCYRLKPVWSDLHPRSFLTRPVCWCPARPPVLPERAQSSRTVPPSLPPSLFLSLPLSSLPTHTNIHFTPGWATERCRPLWSTVGNDTLVFIRHGGKEIVEYSSINMIKNIPSSWESADSVHVDEKKKGTQLKKQQWKLKTKNPRNKLTKSHFFLLYFFG